MEIPVPVQPSWLRRASAPLPGFSAPGRLFDQRFGEGLLEAELASLCPAAIAPYYLRAPSVALPTAQVPGLGRETAQLLTKLGSGSLWGGIVGMSVDFELRGQCRRVGYWKSPELGVLRPGYGSPEGWGLIACRAEGLGHSPWSLDD